MSLKDILSGKQPKTKKKVVVDLTKKGKKKPKLAVPPVKK